MNAAIHESILVNDRVDALSDGAFRVFIMAVTWSVAQGTDGELPERAVKRLHPDGVRRDLITELVEDSFLIPIDNGYQIRNFLSYQTPNETVQRAREVNRRRKQEQRRREQQKAIDKLAGQPNVTHDGQRDGQRDVTHDGRRGLTETKTEPKTEPNSAIEVGSSPSSDPFIGNPDNGYHGGAVNKW
jgi:hypothetical protein